MWFTDQFTVSETYLDPANRVNIESYLEAEKRHRSEKFGAYVAEKVGGHSIQPRRSSFLGMPVWELRLQIFTEKEWDDFRMAVNMASSVEEVKQLIVGLQVGPEERKSYYNTTK